MTIAKSRAVQLNYRLRQGVNAPLKVLDGAGESLDLTGQERELLPLLTACRLAQRLLLGHWVVASAPDDADAVRRSLEIATRQLDALRPLLPVDLG